MLLILDQTPLAHRSAVHHHWPSAYIHRYIPGLGRSTPYYVARSDSLTSKSGFSHNMKTFWEVQFLDSSHSSMSKFQIIRAKMARISA